MAVAPFEIVAGPATVYIGPIGEAFPVIDLDPPGGNWTDIGRTEGGVTVAVNQTANLIRADQATGPLKAIRSEEEVRISFSFADLTVENFARAINDNTVTDTAAASMVAGHRAVFLFQTDVVAQVAMLIRGPSPYRNAFLQFELPVVSQIGNPEASFTKDDKAILAVEYVSLEDQAASTPAERFGTLRAEDENALP